MSGSSSSSTAHLTQAYINESHTGRILAVQGTLTGLAVIVVLLRIYTRVRLVKLLGADDYVMIATIVTAVGGFTCFAIEGAHGLGRHYDTISKSDSVIYNHASWVQTFMSAMISIGLLKISIILSLMRFATIKWYRFTLWALAVFVVLYSITAIFSNIFRCIPPDGVWDPALKSTAKCYGISTLNTFGLINTIFNIFTDVCLATLPVPLIWTLQLKLQARISLIVVLSLGYFAVAVGIVKAYYQFNFAKLRDRSFDQNVQVWGYYQLTIGIIAACIPSLKPLFKNVLRLTSRYQSSRMPASGPAKSTNRTKSGYLRQTDPDIELPQYADKSYNAQVHGGKGFYNGSVGTTRSGSEERILSSSQPMKDGGILATTEITVR